MIKDTRLSEQSVTALANSFFSVLNGCELELKGSFNQDFEGQCFSEYLRQNADFSPFLQAITLS